MGGCSSFGVRGGNGGRGIARIEDSADEYRSAIRVSVLSGADEMGATIEKEKRGIS